MANAAAAPAPAPPDASGSAASPPRGKAPRRLGIATVALPCLAGATFLGVLYVAIGR